MKARDINIFFTELDKRIDFPMQVILTGGAAGILQGVERVTQDIDFELHVKTSHQAAAQAAILETGRMTGITPQYAEDIDRWSSIVLPKRTSRRYAKIGKIEIRILEPGLWAIGKLTRFLSSDVGDLVIVLKTNPTDPKKLARLWGQALGMSPASNQQALYRRQVESFFENYSREIWGGKANAEELTKIFLETAQKQRAHKSGSKR